MFLRCFNNLFTIHRAEICRNSAPIFVQYHNLQNHTLLYKRQKNLKKVLFGYTKDTSHCYNNTCKKPIRQTVETRNNKTEVFIMKRTNRFFAGMAAMVIALAFASCGAAENTADISTETVKTEAAAATADHADKADRMDTVKAVSSWASTAKPLPPRPKTSSPRR